MILLDASVRISIVAVIVAVTLRVMRVDGSGTRHAVWTVVLAAMLLMPALPAIVPSFTVSVPGRAAAVLSRVVVPPVLSIDSAPRAASDQDRPPATVITAPTPSSPLSNRAPAPATSRWPIWSFVVAAYVLGAILLLLRLATGWHAVARLARKASPTAITCTTPVRESALLATPLTAGVLAPVIILPEGWTAWPAEKLRACLAHELAHIQRRDPLIAFVGHINRCVFWFHPLAWWLERTLATTAEEAADEAAARAIGDRRRYAEVLLDIANAVRRRGTRVAWQGLGADGTGRLGRRVDRLLRVDAAPEISRVRKCSVFATCTAAIVVVAACQQHQHVPPPLQPDPELAEQLEKRKANEALYKSAEHMTATEIGALEASLTRTPEDFDALRKLQHFYHVSGQKVFGWNEMITRRRPHILWVIDHHPEHELAIWMVSAEADPVGYAEAKQHWLAQTTKSDAGEKVLTNAATFFTRPDPRIAEELLVRAWGMATPPDRRRALSRRLGRFYADVIKGPTDPRNGAPLTRPDSDRYARDVRRRLIQSDDAALLASAGEVLVRTWGDADRPQLGVQLLQRAVLIDPQQPSARALLVSFEDHDRDLEMRNKLRLREAALAGGDLATKIAAGQPLTAEERTSLRQAQPQAVADLPEHERLMLLPTLADNDYIMAEDIEWQKDRVAATASFARSRKYAQDTLALTPKLRDDPNYGWAVYHATVALAAHALREGDKPAAVRYMLEATRVPPSRGLERQSFGLDRRLVNYLLKEGERETVAAFLERSADLRAGDGEQLLKDAAAIRAGKMPMSFQYMVSRN